MSKVITHGIDRTSRDLFADLAPAQSVSSGQLRAPAAVGCHRGGPGVGEATMVRCEICHVRIPQKRIRAMPDTRLCVACKDQYDEPPLTIGSVMVQKALAGIDEDELLKIANSAA